MEDVEDTFVRFCEFAYAGDHFSEWRLEIGNSVAALIEEEEARDGISVDWEVPQAEDVVPR